jgi:hypothetical protein
MIYAKNLYLFVVRRKKTNKCLLKRLILASIYCPFYIGHDIINFFEKQLCTHVVCEEVHVKLLFKVFDIFKMRQICISNKESICTHKPKHHLPRKFSEQKMGQRASRQPHCLAYSDRAYYKKRVTSLVR